VFAPGRFRLLLLSLLLFVVGTAATADVGPAAPSPLRYRYFSFLSLTTLGYGDAIPVTVLAGTLASLETIGGQLYIGITVARLVGLSLTERAR
jgi:hypothetical protein